MNLSQRRRCYKSVPLILTLIVVTLSLFIATRPHTLTVEVRPLLTGTYIMAEITAYSAEVAQTDSRPREMANGQEVHERAIACPSKYDFGTGVIVNGKHYECADRMAKRFRGGEYYDIFMEDTKLALEFGRQYLVIEIIK